MIRNWLRNFMIGRYGVDQLNVALLVTTMLLNLVSSVIRNGTVSDVMRVLTYVLLIWAFFRMLSRNIVRRRAENDRFIRYWWPVKQSIKKKLAMFKARKTHKFYKCPGCRNTLRVPKGKGKVQITCPKCGERFSKTT